jgi:hypothetical protein
MMLVLLALLACASAQTINFALSTCDAAEELQYGHFSNRWVSSVFVSLVRRRACEAFS